MKKAAWCLGAMIFAFAGTAEATSVNLSPSAESYVGRSYDGTVSAGPFSPQPFGTLVGLIDHAQSGHPEWAAESRSLFEFDLGAIAPSSITSAILRFTAVDPTNYGAGSCFDLIGCPELSLLNLFGFDGDGLSNVLDFDLGAFLMSVDPRPAETPLAVDVTTFLTTVASGYAGFNIRAGSVNGAMGLLNVSLDIDYPATSVPEPGTLALLGLSLAGLGLGRRRRANRPSAGINTTKSLRSARTRQETIC